MGRRGESDGSLLVAWLCMLRSWGTTNRKAARILEMELVTTFTCLLWGSGYVSKLSLSKCFGLLPTHLQRHLYASRNGSAKQTTWIAPYTFLRWHHPYPQVFLVLSGALRKSDSVCLHKITSSNTAAIPATTIWNPKPLQITTVSFCTHELKMILHG